MEKALPAIPAKRYFTIGEVSDLCGVKPYVLRYWEQEFTQLKPMKRRGNRRYYQHHEVLLIRRIRELLYEQGFTISGARNRLTELVHGRGMVVEGEGERRPADASLPELQGLVSPDDVPSHADPASLHEGAAVAGTGALPPLSSEQLRLELMSIRDLLSS